MYNFIDVNEVSEGVVLPSEALKINGEYIENLIPGYRTLNVSGRESLSRELESFETGTSDGETLKNKRYPARIITVTYQLISASNEAFRAAFNTLASVLNVEDAELIFNDETDKFFKGTPGAIGEVEPGLNSIIGTFELFCADPFKYSVIEHEVEPELTDKTFLIDYNGTYKAFPTLEAEFYNEDEGIGALLGLGDCGYVAFFNEDEKIIQLGDPDEAATETYAKSQTLVSQQFKSETAWNAIAQANWATNSGKISSSDFPQVGSVGMKPSAHSITVAPTTSGTLLTATSRAATPYINYKVVAQASGRTENSVKVKVTITASLAAASNYFGKNYGLKGSIQFNGGDWHTVTIKSESVRWEGNGGHTVTLTATVKNLEASTTLLEDIKFKVERTDDNGNTGKLDETNCNDLAISAYTAPVISDWYLSAASYGTGSSWHGPSITRTIPADAAGDVGASNFTFTYHQKLSIGADSTATQEIGEFQALVISGSGSSRKILAGVNIYKGSVGKTAKLRFYVNEKIMQTIDIDLSLNNQYFGNNSPSKGIVTVKTSTITKTGNRIDFNIGGIKKTFYDSAITNVKATQTTFYFAQFSTKPALSYNGLYWAKFVKNNCDTFENIPNKFSANDVVIADCKSGEVLLNNTPTPSLGALGNDWEDFYLKPGINQIGFSYSDWVFPTYAPKFKIRYREVFI